ncbi:hypothetical protein HYU17_03325 [Candidatus Woesearchaeota archaeon]|nr:hypothetical protein [Candidatus Woesearchaeota archaeon]
MFEMLKLPKESVFTTAALLLAFSLLLASFATAQDEEQAQGFTVSLKAVNDSITLDGQAVFELTINNLNNYPERFRISVPDIEWSVQSDPLFHYFSGVDVPAFGSEKVMLLFKPVVPFSPGLRSISANVEAVRGKQSQALSAFVNIRSIYPLIGEYLAAVSRIVDIPFQIDPRNEFEIRVNLINRNPRNISSMRILLTSVSTSLINEEIITDLRPLESKVVSKKVKFDPLTSPVKDTLKVVLFVNGQSLEPTIFEKFEVAGYSEVKALNSERKGRFFRWVNETTYVNDGNVKAQKVVEHRTSLLKLLFTKTVPKSFTISRDGSRFSAWELTLESQETATIQVVESYRSLIYLLVISIIFLVLYRFFQSPVQLIKEASAISYKEGGVSELKVVLRVKNKSSQPYVRLTIMDRVPMIAEVEHDTLGTIKPSKVFTDAKGSVVKWELESLDRHEERVLAYKIHSKLSILGQFTLPKASAKFFTEKSVRFVTHSNMVVIKP